MDVLFTALMQAFGGLRVAHDAPTRPPRGHCSHVQSLTLFHESVTFEIQAARFGGCPKGESTMRCAIFLCVLVMSVVGCDYDGDGVDDGDVPVSVGDPACFGNAAWNRVEQVCEVVVPADADTVVIAAQTPPPCPVGQAYTADGCVVQHCSLDRVVFGGRCTLVGQIVFDARGDEEFWCEVQADSTCTRLP